MQLVGKVRGTALVDVAKGKGAEAHDVRTVTAKLDGTDGVKESITIVSDDLDLGDTVIVEVSLKQQKLDIGGQRRTSRRSAASAEPN